MKAIKAGIDDAAAADPELSYGKRDGCRVYAGMGPKPSNHTPFAPAGFASLISTG